MSCISVEKLSFSSPQATLFSSEVPILKWMPVHTMGIIALSSFQSVGAHPQRVSKNTLHSLIAKASNVKITFLAAKFASVHL